MVVQNFSVIFRSSKPVMGNGTVDVEGMDLNSLMPLKCGFHFAKFHETCVHLKNVEYMGKI